jgi:hypothetical protein
MEKEIKPKEEMVEVKKSEIAALFDRIKKLENPGDIDLDEPKVHTCTVRFFGGKPISRIYDVVTNGKDKVSGDEKMLCQIDVLEDDGKLSKHEVDYLKMLDTFETVKAELVKVNRVDCSTKHGKVAVSEVKDYNTISTGIYVPLKVTTYEYSFVVKLPNGREVELKKINS